MRQIRKPVCCGNFRQLNVSRDFGEIRGTRYSGIELAEQIDDSIFRTMIDETPDQNFYKPLQCVKYQECQLWSHKWYKLAVDLL